MKRLDRIFVNKDWLEKFPNSSVTHVPKTNSNPLLLKLRLTPSLPINKPFILKTIWAIQPDFINKVKENWLGDDLVTATTNFEINIVDWKTNVFGDIFIRKKIF